MFSAYHETYGQEVWISKGTADSTQLVGDIESGANGSEPTHLRSIGSKAVFLAYSSDVGRDLWAVTVRDGDFAAAGDWQLFE